MPETMIRQMRDGALAEIRRAIARRDVSAAQAIERQRGGVSLRLPLGEAVVIRTRRSRTTPFYTVRLRDFLGRDGYFVFCFEGGFAVCDFDEFASLLDEGDGIYASSTGLKPTFKVCGQTLEMYVNHERYDVSAWLNAFEQVGAPYGNG